MVQLNHPYLNMLGGGEGVYVGGLPRLSFNFKTPLLLFEMWREGRTEIGHFQCCSGLAGWRSRLRPDERGVANRSAEAEVWVDFSGKSSKTHICQGNPRGDDAAFPVHSQRRFQQARQRSFGRENI